MPGPRVAVGVLDGSEMGMFVGRPGGGGRHSPLGSGVKLALCEEGREGMGLLCVKSVLEQEPWILFLKTRIGSDIISEP